MSAKDQAPGLKAFAAELERFCYGETPPGCCVKCKAQAHRGKPGEPGAIYSEAGAREFKISKWCETCWDREFKDED